MDGFVTKLNIMKSIDMLTRESVWSVKGGRLRLVSEKIDTHNP